MKVLVVALALAAAPAAAQVNKCQGADGKVVYSDKPCPASAAAKTVDTSANSVSQQDQTELRAKRQALEAKIEAREAADAATRERQRADRQAWRDECQGYLDNIKRQEAWLSGMTQAVRDSARAEIAIQRRKFNDADCKRVM